MRNALRTRWFVTALFVIGAGAAGCGASPSREARALPDPIPEPTTLYKFAEELAARGELVRAEQYALLAVENGFPARRSLPLLLSVCLRSSRVTSALAHAEPVLRAFPGDPRLRYLVASIYAALHRPEDAKRELAEVLRLDPTHNEAASLLLALSEEAP